jgi:hypothetical protein
MPSDLWHNVIMSQAAAIPAAAPPLFRLDWEAANQGVPLSALEEFAAYSGFAVKDLLEIVIPARTLKHRRQRQEPLSLEGCEALRSRSEGLWEPGQGPQMADET